MDIFDRLKAAAANDWRAYVDHDFVRRLGDGALCGPRHLLGDFGMLTSLTLSRFDDRRAPATRLHS